MLYVPGTETFAANGSHYRKRVLQKSESLRAELRYCQCGWGDNYLLNKLPNPLAKHTTYPRKSCAIIKPRKTIDGFL